MECAEQKHGFSDHDNGTSHDGWDRSNLAGGAPVPADGPHYDRFLTRQLGPQGYGLMALALTTIIWVESAITSFFAKATSSRGRNERWNQWAPWLFVSV